VVSEKIKNTKNEKNVRKEIIFEASSELNRYLLNLCDLRRISKTEKLAKFDQFKRTL
jgi:hypothetical protein